MIPDAVEVGFRSEPSFLVGQNTVHDDNGVVYQHSHGYDECPQGDTLQGSTAHQQDGEGYGDGQYQSEADDDSAAESHGEYQHEDDNQDRFYQVDHERTDGLIHFIGLEEYLFRFHTDGNLLHDFCQPFVYSLSYVGHNGILFQGKADGQCRLSVDEEAVPLRLGIGAFYLRYIFQADLLSLWSTDKQVTDIGLIGHRTAYMQLYPVVSVQVIACVHRLSGILQTHHDLGGDNSVTGNLLFRQSDVDDLIPVAADEDTFHSFYSQQFPAYQLGILIQFGIGISVAFESVEDAVHVHHIIHYNRIVTP